MKIKIFLSGVFLLGIFAVPSRAEWQVVYQTDFSSDPGWMTSNGTTYHTNYHWDESRGAYFQKEIDGSNEYVYMQLSSLEAGYKWRLEYDLEKTFSSGASDARFGFYDSDMTNYSPCYLIANQYASSPSPFLLEWSTTTSTKSIDIPGTPSFVGYHILMEYDFATRNAYARVNRISDGEILGETTQTIGLLQGIDRIGMSTIADGLGGTGESYIDNVVVMQTPEPTTLLLLGLGGILLRRRQKHTRA
jgi:hypothetical protein